jgi:WD40 repeat protein
MKPQVAQAFGLVGALLCSGAAYAACPPSARDVPQVGDVYPPSSIVAFAVRNDFQLAAGHTADGTVVLWNLETGVQGELIPCYPYVAILDFHPAGETLALGTAQGVIDLVNISTGQQMNSLEGRKDWITRLVFSPDGRLLASARHKGVVVADSATGEEMLFVAGDGISSIAFSSDATQLALARERPGAIELWDVVTGTRIRRIELQAGQWVNDLLFVSNDAQLVSADGMHTITVWDLATGHRIRTQIGHRDQVVGLVLSHNRQVMYSVDDSGLVCAWDLSTGALLNSWEPPAEDRVGIPSRDSRFLFTLSEEEGVIEVWDLHQGTVRKTLTYKSPYDD